MCVYLFRRLIVFGTIFVGMLYLCPSIQAAVPCENLFKTGEFLAAAQCFQRQANLMPPVAQLSKVQRYLKGQTLQNAALAFQKAAAAEQNAEAAAYRREQAVSTLRQYLDENLCQKNYLCQQARGNILELLNQIKYTTFSVVTLPGKRAIVKVEGYEFKVQHIAPPAWSQSVRPGRYVVEVRYEGKSAVQQEVIVSPGQARTVTVLGDLQTPPSTGSVGQRPSIVPWIVLGLGVVAAGTGAVLLGLGAGKVTQRDAIALQIANDASNKSPAERLTLASSPDTANRIKEMDGAHHSAASLLPTGWILASVGAATAVTGVVLFFVLRPKPPTPQTALPGSTATVFVVLEHP